VGGLSSSVSACTRDGLFCCCPCSHLCPARPMVVRRPFVFFLVKVRPPACLSFSVTPANHNPFRPFGDPSQPRGGFFFPPKFGVFRGMCTPAPPPLLLHVFLPPWLCPVAPPVGCRASPTGEYRPSRTQPVACPPLVFFLLPGTPLVPPNLFLVSKSRPQHPFEPRVACFGFHPFAQA